MVLQLPAKESSSGRKGSNPLSSTIIKLLTMSRTFRKSSSWRLRRGEKYSKTLRDGSYQHACNSCHNNGGCPVCEGNRLYKHNKQVTLKEELTCGE